MSNRICFGLFMAAAIFAQTGFADESVYQSDACILSRTDPYDLGEVMHEGDYKGQCMDTSLRRPAVILSEDDSKITIANFFHAGTFWIAEIPKAGVDQVIFQIAQFPFAIPLVKFAHNQLRFVMKSGVMIELTPQDTASKLAPTVIDQLNFVDQPTGPKGRDEYEASKGLHPTYGNMLRVMGTIDRAHEELGGNDDTTRQFLLKMTDDEKNMALINGVRLSAKFGYDDIYRLFSENCMTTAFDILDESVTYKKHVKPFKQRPWDIHDPVVGPSIRALKKRELIDKEIESWNEETGLR